MDNYNENNVESSGGTTPNEEQNEVNVLPVNNEQNGQQNPYEPPNQSNYSVDPTPQKSTTNTMAIVGFILSIVSLFVFGIPLGIAALAVSVIGLTKGEGNKGLAIAGIVIAIIAIILAILGTIWLSAFYSYF